MKEQSLKEQIWGILFPILLYFILSMIVPGVLGMVWSGFLLEEYSMWILTASNLLQLPVFFWMYRRDRLGRTRETGRVYAGDVLLVLLASLFLSRGLNYLIAVTALPSWFPGYEAVTEGLYESSILSQIAASVISASLLEEVLMRGILYSRLRGCVSDWRIAWIASAVIFGLFHGNVVQGVYAFALGLFFAWMYEIYGNLWMPIAAHMAANGISILAERKSLMDMLERRLEPGMVQALYYLLPCAFLFLAYVLIRRLARMAKKHKKGLHKYKEKP